MKDIIELLQREDDIEQEEKQNANNTKTDECAVPNNAGNKS